MKGRSGLRERGPIRLRTHTHIYTYSRAYTYMHIRSAGYSVKDDTTERYAATVQRKIEE